MGRKKGEGKNIELTYCACGCGNKRPAYDKHGFSRVFLPGHNSRMHPGRFNNPTIECACGCGEKRFLYDKKLRKRMYLPGHHRRKVGNLNMLVSLVQNTGSCNAAADVIGVNNATIAAIFRRHGVEYEVDLTKTGGSSAFGRKAELDALSILPGSVDMTQKRANLSPFDILWQGKRIDVKASVIKKAKRNSNFLRWAFSTGKQDKCDEFLCIGYNDNLEIALTLLIPSNIAPSCVSVPISLNSKWKQYTFGPADSLHNVG